MPLQPVLTATAQQRILRASTTPGSGAAQLVGYFVGQVVGSLDRVRQARQVFLDMVEEYAETVGAMHQRVLASAT